MISLPEHYLSVGDNRKNNMHKSVSCPSCTHKFDVPEDQVTNVCQNCGVIFSDKAVSVDAQEISEEDVGSVDGLFDDE